MIASIVQESSMQYPSNMQLLYYIRYYHADIRYYHAEICYYHTEMFVAVSRL